MKGPHHHMMPQCMQIYANVRWYNDIIYLYICWCKWVYVDVSECVQPYDFHHQMYRMVTTYVWWSSTYIHVHHRMMAHHRHDFSRNVLQSGHGPTYFYISESYEIFIDWWVVKWVCWWWTMIGRSYVDVVITWASHMHGADQVNSCGREDSASWAWPYLVWSARWPPHHHVMLTWCSCMSM